jgi:nucleotide-binding universal stress UspA family protein
VVEIKKILVPIDGSRCSDEALRYAAEMSKRFDASITMMHVYVPPETTREMPTTQLREEAKQKMVKSKKILQKMNVECKCVFTTGQAAENILKESEKGYDLVIMGSRGMGFVKGFLLGSTTTRVAHHAKIPVMIVHCNK